MLKIVSGPETINKPSLKFGTLGQNGRRNYLLKSVAIVCLLCDNQKFVFSQIQKTKSNMWKLNQ